jgi:hypothetical protein
MPDVFLFFSACFFRLFLPAASFFAIGCVFVPSLRGGFWEAMLCVYMAAFSISLAFSLLHFSSVGYHYENAFE